MKEVGRICVKTAGRDAGKYCVIVSEEDNNQVLIDGETRRRTVNLKHLEPTTKKIDIKEGASHKDVVSKFEELDLNPRRSKK